MTFRNYTLKYLRDKGYHVYNLLSDDSGDVCMYGQKNRGNDHADVYSSIAVLFVLATQSVLRGPAILILAGQLLDMQKFCPSSSPTV